jgi:hypothetical protein
MDIEIDIFHESSILVFSPEAVTRGKPDCIVQELGFFYLTPQMLPHVRKYPNRAGMNPPPQESLMKFLLLALMSLSFLSCASYENREPSSVDGQERAPDAVHDYYGGSFR